MNTLLITNILLGAIVVAVIVLTVLIAIILVNIIRLLYKIKAVLHLFSADVAHVRTVILAVKEVLLEKIFGEAKKPRKTAPVKREIKKK